MTAAAKVCILLQTKRRLCFFNTISCFCRRNQYSSHPNSFVQSKKSACKTAVEWLSQFSLSYGRFCNDYKARFSFRDGFVTITKLGFLLGTHCKRPMLFQSQTTADSSHLLGLPHTLPNRCDHEHRFALLRSRCHNALPTGKARRSYCSPPSFGVCSTGRSLPCVCLSPCRWLQRYKFFFRDGQVFQRIFFDSAQNKTQGDSPLKRTQGDCPPVSKEKRKPR